MRSRARFAAIALIAGLGACGQEEGRGGLTAEEERQLDNAAQMLDENMVDMSDVAPDSLVANEAEIEAMEAENDAAEANALTNGQ